MAIVKRGIKRQSIKSKGATKGKQAASKKTLRKTQGRHKPAKSSASRRKARSAARNTRWG